MSKITKKDWWNQILSMGAAVINKSKYGTAMDPILILTSLVTLPCFILWYFTKFWPLLLIAIAPVIQFIRVYDYYMKHDPKMLRTEKHEETMLRLSSSLGQKGHEVTEETIDALPAVKADKTHATAKPELIVAKKERT